jgi:hypothetical protein
MKSLYIYDNTYLAHFFLEWEMCQTKVVEKNQTQFSLLSYRKSCCSWDNEEKYGRAGQATDDNITGVCALHAC